MHQVRKLSSAVCCPPRAGQPLLGQRLGQRVHAVQRHPADLVGVLGRVHRPEPGPVGEPEVVELLVAQRLAHHVQVAGHVHGAHVGEDRPGVLLALGRHLAQLPQRVPRIARLLAVGRLQRTAGGVGPAAHRGGTAHAARVERHHVVVVGQTEEVLTAEGQALHAGAARTAEVQHDRAARVAGGRAVAGERQLQGALARVGVVERHGDRPALEVLRQLRARAGRPLDLLVVEPAQAGLVAPGGRQARRQQDQSDGPGRRAAPEGGRQPVGLVTAPESLGQLAQHRSLPRRPDRRPRPP